MTDEDLDRVGPIDFLVVGFPAGESNFQGEGLGELVKLVDAGVIRVIDVAVVAKNSEGALDAVAVSDAPGLGDFAQLEAGVAELLSAEVLADIAPAMGPGDVAGVLVYENLWAAPFGSATRRAGGRLIADGRIHSQAIIAAVAAQN